MASKVGDLFTPEPDRWGLRGDPYVWQALQRHLADKDIPATDDELRRLLYDGMIHVAQVDLANDPESMVFRREFAHGGMSSGGISLDTWRERLIPLLIERRRVSTR